MPYQKTIVLNFIYMYTKKILLCILPMPLILFIINAVEAGRTCHIEGVAAFMNAKQSGKLMAKKML